MSTEEIIEILKCRNGTHDDWNTLHVSECNIIIDKLRAAEKLASSVEDYNNGNGFWHHMSDALENYRKAGEDHT